MIARILNHIAPLGYQGAALGFVRGVEPVGEIQLPRLFAQQRSHVVTEGQGQGVGVQHHEKEL